MILLILIGTILFWLFLMGLLLEAYDRLNGKYPGEYPTLTEINDTLEYILEENKMVLDLLEKGPKNRK